MFASELDQVFEGKLHWHKGWNDNGTRVGMTTGKRIGMTIGTRIGVTTGFAWIVLMVNIFRDESREVSSVSIECGSFEKVELALLSPLLLVLYAVPIPFH